MRVISLACLLTASCGPKLTGFHSHMLSVTRGALRPVDQIMQVEAPDVSVIALDHPVLGSSVAGVTRDRDRIVYGAELEQMSAEMQLLVATHEVAHTRVIEHWSTLPIWLEEGLVHTIAVTIYPSLRSMVEGHMASEDRRGYWIVQELGLEETRALARRAEALGLVEIPDDWLPEVSDRLDARERQASSLAERFSFHGGSEVKWEFTADGRTILRGKLPEGSETWSVDLNDL